MAIRVPSVLGIVLCLGIAPVLSGCATSQTPAQRQASACGGLGSGNKQDVGTAVGAVAGGVLVGLLTHNVAAGFGGAAAGGLIGNRVGAALDAQDCRALIIRSADALRATPDGEAVDWTSARTGAGAQIVPTNTRMVSRSISIRRQADVAPTPGLEIIGATYLVRRDADVHLAPAAGSPVVHGLSAGDHVRVVGKVPEQPWLMVAQGGTSIGYVGQALLSSPQQQASAHRPVRRHGVPATVVASTSSPAFDLDAADAPLRPADLDATDAGATPAAAAPVVDVVTASVQCRDLTTTLTVKGSSDRSASTACRSPDGAWELDDAPTAHS